MKNTILNKIILTLAIICFLGSLATLVKAEASPTLKLEAPAPVPSATSPAPYIPPPKPAPYLPPTDKERLKACQENFQTVEGAFWTLYEAYSQTLTRCGKRCRPNRKN